MKDHTRHSFDLLSEKAEEQLRRWKTDPYDKSLYEAEVRFVSENAPPPGVVVELGCGWDPYTELVNKGHRLTAIDFSYESLRKVRADFDGLSLVCADANHVPVKDESTDLVIATDELICCDSVTASQMLSEAHRILRPGGLLILEYDTKWCLDTLWMLIDSLCGNRIGYEVTRKEMVKLFGRSGGGMVKWGLAGSDEVLRIRFFTHREMGRMLNEGGFRVLKKRGILILAGIIPTVVQQNTKNKLALVMANLLALVDRSIGGLPILNSFGGDTLILAQKIGERRQGEYRENETHLR